MAWRTIMYLAGSLVAAFVLYHGTILIYWWIKDWGKPNPPKMKIVSANKRVPQKEVGHKKPIGVIKGLLFGLLALIASYGLYSIFIRVTAPVLEHAGKKIEIPAKKWAEPSGDNLGVVPIPKPKQAFAPSRLKDNESGLVSAKKPKMMHSSTLGVEVRMDDEPSNSPSKKKSPDFFQSDM